MTNVRRPIPFSVTASVAVWQRKQSHMVEAQIITRGVKDQLVIDAMRRVPRHRFVLTHSVNEAYEDYPLSIGYGQTISQPYIVAFMTEALELQSSEKVLEIGTGSGYQTSILAEIVSQVFSVEVVEPLSRGAQNILCNLGYDHVSVRVGDGYTGWPQEAPFDAIILTAAPGHIPEPLLEQLRVGGRLILPVGSHSQSLLLIHRTSEGYSHTKLLDVSFVPMTGQARHHQS
ncbi:MAG: protein-L-isoaspartate(D-aspartate) O-methyltransferase [Nitrospirales bacterium]